MSEKKEKAQPASPPKSGEKKREHYRQKECPYCGVHVGNLGNHIRMKHGEQAKAEGHTLETPEVSKEALLSGEKPKKPELVNVPIYYCTACRAKLKKGENPCWHCGEYLNWEGVS